MSEIFEALRKAQREADNRGAAPVEGSEVGACVVLSDVSDVTEVTERVGVVPGRTTRASRRHRRFAWIGRLRRTPDQNGRRTHESTVLMSPSQETAIGEQFRILRTRIELAGPGTVMITSALDQEGKTLCAVNLAVALSMRIGVGVVLVDADLRHPNVAMQLGVRSGPGLVDCLLGEARWQDCIVSSAYERLSVLPAGRSSAIAPELLGSERMGTVMSELKSAFPNSHILVDAPPLLLTADPMVIARQMDHILLVIRAGVTPRAAVQKAVDTLGAERFFGAILNGATDHLSHYYYNGRYAYPQHREGTR